MKSLRTSAAQSEVRKRITQASISGAALFCFSVGLPQTAQADEVTQASSVDTSTAVVLPQNPASTVLGTSTAVSPSNQETVTVVSLSSISNEIDSATTTLQTAITKSTTTLQAIPFVQIKIPTIPVAQAAVDSATAAIQNANAKIDLAHQALETATVTAALVPVAQSGVDSATAAVVDAASLVSHAQEEVATSTATVATTKLALDTRKDAQANLDAAAACTEGSACVNFYNQNALLGPVHDQVVLAQAAADAAVVAAPIAQAAADSSTITTVTDGVTATVYQGTGRSPALPSENTAPILTTTVPQIAFQWGSGSVMGGPSDRVIVKYTGMITVPDDAVAVKYAVSSDDGSMMYIDGQLAINNWRDQGTSWSGYSPTYNTETNKQQNFVIWYYENGGGASCTLGWAIFRADGTGYFTTPGSSAFGATTTTKDPALVAAAAAAQAAIPTTAQAVVDAQAAYDAKLSERNAAWDAYTAVISAARAGAQAIDAAQSAYDLAQQDLTKAQETLASSQQSLATAQKTLATQQTVLAVAQTTSASAADAAVSAAEQALQASDTAAVVLDQSTKIIQKALEKKVTPSVPIVVPQPEPAPAPQPEPAPAPVVDPTPAPAPEPAPEPNPIPAPEPAPAPDPTPAPTPDPTPAPSPAPEPAPSPAPVPAPEPSPTPAPTPEPVPSPQPPVVVPGLVSNNPDQLSDTTPKVAPAEVLVAHVQVDKPGVENGGIEFFGTKSAPQVVGEDGKLTPPAPPPGSGLPIPPEAITTQDTFIGQPGGTTFNAPDIAVPVIETPVTGAMAAVPGVQALNHAFVAMANIGNDMSPVTRKKAKKILVLTTVIAAVRRRFN